MTSDNNEQKKCGFCGESIPIGARRCPYCGSVLEITFNNDYRITPSENQTVNNTDETKPEDVKQTQVEQNAEVNSGTAEPQNAANQQENTGFNGISMPGYKAEQQREEQKNRIQGGERPYNNNSYIPNRKYEKNMGNPLSNGLKVFLTILFTIIPGIGQLAGIITAIVFMNSEGDSDRKSFGVAILVASLIMFVFACIGCFIMVIAVSSSNQFNY